MTRLPALDSLRGALLLIMAINHISTDLRFLTEQPLGYFSAAEGFVFLSGLLAGKVYAQRAMNHGLQQAVRAALARTVQIYRAHVVCIGLVLVWCVLHVRIAGFPAPASPEMFVERPLAGPVAAALFIYRPGLFDTLPLYCVSFVFVPVVVAAQRAGYIPHVLVASATLWAAANLFTGREPYVDGLINTGAFHFMAWQLLFVLAAVIGVRWSTGAFRWSAPRPAILAVVGAMALWFAAARHGFVSVAAVMGPLTDKMNLAPLRLVNSALIFFLIAHAIRAFPRLFGWGPLELLGRHSLAVFTIHIVVAQVLLGLPGLFESTTGGRALGALVLVGAMFLAALLAEARGSKRPADVSAPSSTLRSSRAGG